MTKAFWLAAMAALISISSAAAQVSGSLSQKASDASELVRIAQSSGSVRIIVTFANPAAADEIKSNPSALQTVQAEVARTQDAIIATHFGSADAPREGAGFPRALRRFPITPGFAVNVNPTELNALSSDPRVVAIHLDKLERPTLNQVLPLIGMPAAYNKNGTGSGYMVAVLDTGVQSNHEFLASSIVAEACFSNAAGAASNVSLCPNGTGTQTGAGAASATTAACISGSQNICTHGSHVAGIVAGSNTSLSSGEPVSGVAKSARVMAIQVFTRFNSDSACGGAGTAPCVQSYNSDLISALNYVANNTMVSGQKAIAVNMSLGSSASTSGTCDSDPRKAPIDTLRSLGIASLVAAGNDYSTTLVGAPGCISTAVTIGSSTKTDVVSSFSNMSATVDLLAPGGEFGSCSLAPGNSNAGIVSSVPNASGSTNVYACYVGTSMATPAAAGAFAAVKSACPSASIDSIESALKTTGLAIFDNRSGGIQTKPRIRVDQAINAICGAVGSTAQLRDFNADGKSDIFWRDSGGSNAVWLMNGTAAPTVALLGSVDTSWTPVGQRDFDGDGKADILWRHTSGSNAIWFMNGSTVTSVVLISSVATNWSVVGTADFNGDGKGDILWRNSSGDLAVWLMNGASVLSVTSLGNVSTGWSVAGVADFDGDGKSDIFWRFADGTNAMWLMNGVSVSSVTGIRYVETNWSFVGTADFNGDGKRDVLWRNTIGDTVVWIMNGAASPSITILGNVGTSWTPVINGDFDGDSKGDIFWREAGGSNAIWLMNGATVSSVNLVGSVTTNWAIQSAGAN